MRFYTQQHRFYAGIDLHARTMHVCVLGHDGTVVFDRNLPARPDALLRALAPFRDGLVVGVECMFAWYWLADLCRKEAIPFALGHALYMKAIHGGKAKNDRIDAGKIARLLRGGTFPLAYAYPKERRGLRDLLRARLRWSASAPGCTATPAAPAPGQPAAGQQRRQVQVQARQRPGRHR
jgi:transposase